MDLQARKLNLITYLTQIQDERFFEEIENYILTKFEKEDHSEFVPFSVAALRTRIEQSEEDFKNARFKTQEDLEKQSSNW